MSGQCGLLIEVTDLMLRRGAAAVPLLSQISSLGTRDKTINSINSINRSSGSETHLAEPRNALEIDSRMSGWWPRV